MFFPKVIRRERKKDPNDQERTMSAFFLFCSEQCPKIKSEHPGLCIGETAKKLVEMWSEQFVKISNNMSRKQLN